MKKRVLCLLCAAAMLALAACEPVGEVNTPTPPPESATPVPTPTPTPEPTSTPTPEPTPATSEDFPFAVLPVTEEAIQNHFAAIGQPVNSITPYEGDYLVEARAEVGGNTYRLYWVFGSTGRTVWLTGALWGIEDYTIEGRGYLLLHMSGSTDTSFYDFPSVAYLSVEGDENGYTGMHDATSIYDKDAYIALEDLVEPATFYFAGAVTGKGCRYVQVSDARIGVNDLSFSFVPSGASMERFNSCTAGPSTTTPSTQMQFDPDSRRLTLRFYNTCLSVKNGLTQKDLQKIMGEWASYYRYPYKFPEGSLGRDNEYLRDVELHADGEDVILTCTVDEAVKSFTVDFYSDDTQRIIFSEGEPNCPVPEVCR